MLNKKTLGICIFVIAITLPFIGVIEVNAQTTTQLQEMIQRLQQTLNGLQSQASNRNLPIISSISPASGPIGTYVTIKGSGFLKTGNTIYFKAPKSLIPGPFEALYEFSNLTSLDGTTLSFVVPSILVQYISEAGNVEKNVIPGEYLVSVFHHGVGYSNAVKFYVTSGVRSGEINCDKEVSTVFELYRCTQLWISQIKLQLNLLEQRIVNLER